VQSVPEIRINLGAGSQHAPGWIGYDRSRAPLLMRSRVLRPILINRLGHWPPETLVRDVTRGIPHPDDSVDVVYSSHTLEHLVPDDARRLLAEAHRVLRPGGLIRIIVPDLERLARAYLGGDRAFFHDTDELLADAFCRGMYAYGASQGLAMRALKRVLRSDDAGHRWMYDETSLTARLVDAGFVAVKRVERGESRRPGAAELDVRGGYHLHMEAEKPLSRR